MLSEILISPICDIPEIQAGDRLADILVEAVGASSIEDHDVFVVSQKLVSKAESKVVALEEPNLQAYDKLVRSEAVRVVRQRGDLIITETKHGYVCANSGVDRSNIGDGYAVLLPDDPDYSAMRIRDRVCGLTSKEVGVIVSDTFGRAWRRGVVDVALGSAGIQPIVNLRGSLDGHGNQLATTEVCVIDELASAAELLKGKSSGHGIVRIRGVNPTWFGEGSVMGDVVRPANEDLFR